MTGTVRLAFKRLRALGGGLSVAALLVAQAALAESAEVEEAASRAADMATLEPGVDTSPGRDNDQSPDAPDALVAADVARGQSGGQVMDRMVLERTEITGNQELPKVLYIVPWQKGDPSDLMGKPVNTLLDEVLAPIDREEFVRVVDYYDELYGDDAE